jgi:hypothetical protein
MAVKAVNSLDLRLERIIYKPSGGVVMLTNDETA